MHQENKAKKVSNFFCHSLLPKVKFAHNTQVQCQPDDDPDLWRQSFVLPYSFVGDTKKANIDQSQGQAIDKGQPNADLRHLHQSLFHSLRIANSLPYLTQQSSLKVAAEISTRWMRSALCPLTRCFVTDLAQSASLALKSGCQQRWCFCKAHATHVVMTKRVVIGMRLWRTN